MPASAHEPTSDISNDQTPLTPSHAFPPTADSTIADPEHARASHPKTQSTASDSHHHHHDITKPYESCASCRAKGKEPFQGHADREEGCTCVTGKENGDP